MCEGQVCFHIMVMLLSTFILPFYLRAFSVQINILYNRNITAVADVLYFVLLKGSLFYQGKLLCNLCLAFGTAAPLKMSTFSLFQRHNLIFCSSLTKSALWLGEHFRIYFDFRVFLERCFQIIPSF